MGNDASFAAIQKKHGNQGVDYVASKYHERKIYERIGDEIKRLHTNANLQEQEDIEYINRQRRKLQGTFKSAKNEAEQKKKGSIIQAEAKSKRKAEQFSGYSEELKKLQNLQKQVKQKYNSERARMQEKVRDQVRKHQAGGSKLSFIQEYDKHPDNYKSNIESECIKKYPQRASVKDSTDLQKKLSWDNYKQNFITILSRQVHDKQFQTANQNIRNNIVPGGAPICC